MRLNILFLICLACLALGYGLAAHQVKRQSREIAGLLQRVHYLEVVVNFEYRARKNAEVSQE